MERVTEAPPSDREPRDRLESLQAELAEARRRLDRSEEAASRAVAELEASLAAEQARLLEARERAKALSRAEEAGRASLFDLEAQLEEARLLARGARRRGYQEWNTPRAFLEGALWLAGLVAVLVLGLTGPLQPLSLLLATVFLLGSSVYEVRARRRARRERLRRERRA
jgi:Flp pilus assembly protein TadB